MISRSPSLDSARHKLARADHHLHELWDELKTFTGGEPYGVRSETNLEGTEQPIRCEYFIDKFTPPPDHWPLLVGDAVQNMRAALDHAAWALVVSERGATFANQYRRSIYFPIKIGPKKFAADFVIQKLSSGARAVLEELQPYKRDARHPERDALWVLNELSIIDKHRALHIIVFHSREVKITAEPFLENGRPELVEKGPLSKGAKVVTFTATRPLAAPYVKVHFQLTTEIAIQAPPGTAAVPLDLGLREIRARTAQALDWVAAL